VVVGDAQMAFLIVALFVFGQDMEMFVVGSIMNEIHAQTGHGDTTAFLLWSLCTCPMTPSGIYMALEVQLDTT
jgi:hypothetical protein